MSEDLEARARWLDKFRELEDGEFREALFAAVCETLMRAGTVGRGVSIVRALTERAADLARQGAALHSLPPDAPRH